MWHKLSLSALLAVVPLVSVGAQPPWEPRYPPPRREVPPIPRQERGYRERDSREVWRYFANRGGTFQRVRGREWAEYRNIGDPLYYREVRRTPDYVELYDEGRDLSVRIYPDKLYQNNGYEGWTPAYDGRWE